MSIKNSYILLAIRKLLYFTIIAYFHLFCKGKRENYTQISPTISRIPVKTRFDEHFCPSNCDILSVISLYLPAVLIAWHKLQLEFIHPVLAVDKRLGIGVGAYACADILIKHRIGEAEIILICLAA